MNLLFWGNTYNYLNIYGLKSIGLATPCTIYPKINLLRFGNFWFFNNLPILIYKNSLHIWMLGVGILMVIFYFNKLYTNLFLIVEHELTNFDDLLCLSLVIIFIFIIEVISFNLGLKYQVWYRLFLNAIVLLVGLLLVIIFNALYTYGLFNIIIIRGAATTPHIFYEYVYDLINYTSFYLRLQIQLIRIFIVIILYYTYYHTLLQYNLIYTITQTTDLNNIFKVVGIIYLLFEYIHIVILFSVQNSALWLILLWLFQFLFSTFILVNYELSR